MINIIAPHRATARAQFNKNMAARPYPIVTASVATRTPLYTPHHTNPSTPTRGPYILPLNSQSHIDNIFEWVKVACSSIYENEKLFHARSCTLIAHTCLKCVGRKKKTKNTHKLFVNRFSSNRCDIKDFLLPHYWSGRRYIRDRMFVVVAHQISVKRCVYIVYKAYKTPVCITYGRMGGYGRLNSILFDCLVFVSV